MSVEKHKEEKFDRNNFRKQLKQGRTDLFGLDLSGLDLTGANLTGANLKHADLRGADLTGADLTGAAGFERDYRCNTIGRFLLEMLYLSIL